MGFRLFDWFNSYRRSTGEVHIPKELAKSALEFLDPTQKPDEPTAILDQLNQAQLTLELDLDGQILSANTLFCQTLGYAATQLVGRNQHILLPVETSQSESNRQLWQQLQDGQIVHGEFCFSHHSGEEIWLAGAYLPVTSADGEITKAVLYAFDVTYIKRFAFKQTLLVGKQEQQVLDKDQSLLEKEQLLASKEQGLREMEQRLAEHEQCLLEKDQKIASNEQSLREMEQKLAEQEQCLIEKDQQVAENKQSLLEKTQLVAEKEQCLLELNQRLDEAEQNSLAKNKQAAELREQLTDYRGQLDAVDKSQAVIEFNMDGTILHANDNFCQAMGYTLQ